MIHHHFSNYKLLRELNTIKKWFILDTVAYDSAQISIKHKLPGSEQFYTNKKELPLAKINVLYLPLHKVYWKYAIF